MEIKRLSQCSLDDAVKAWNRGFEGYFVQIDMTSDMFIKRMASEDLSAEHSIIAFSEGEPVGVVLNGFRELGGKKVAWNGGTGVAAEYRGKGCSRKLMEETLNIYAAEGVNVATLEAIEANDKAINLYKRFGYEVTDHLFYLSKAFKRTEQVSSYKTLNLHPEQLSKLDFYDDSAPWQCQWQSVKHGESIIAIDEDGEEIGYGLFKKVFNPEGAIEKLILFQLHLREGVSDQLGILYTILNGAVGKQDLEVIITAVNFPATKAVTSLLINNGFEKQFGQVKMEKYL